MKFNFFTINRKRQFYLIKTFRLAIIIILALPSISSSLKAKEIKIKDRTKSIDFSVGFGLYNGLGKEFVYENGRNLSLLDWYSDNIPVFKFDINYNINTIFILNFRGWTSLGKSPSYMDDYDWFDQYQSNPTHHSWHPNTKLNYANEFDLNLQTLLRSQDDYKLYAILGYQMNSFSWSAIGGSYLYYNGLLSGEVDNIPAIDYDQNFNMPYIGIKGQYNTNNLELNLFLKYSPLVSGKEKDIHHLRDLLFKGEANGNYVGGIVNANYNITTNLRFFVDFTCNAYLESVGDVTSYKASTNEINQSSKDAMGIYNRSFILSTGLNYIF